MSTVAINERGQLQRLEQIAGEIYERVEEAYGIVLEKFPEHRQAGTQFVGRMTCLLDDYCHYLAGAALDLEATAPENGGQVT